MGAVVIKRNASRFVEAWEGSKLMLTEFDPNSLIARRSTIRSLDRPHNKNLQILQMLVLITNKQDEHIQNVT